MSFESLSLAHRIVSRARSVGCATFVLALLSACGGAVARDGDVQDSESGRDDVGDERQEGDGDDGADACTALPHCPRDRIAYASKRACERDFPGGSACEEITACGSSIWCADEQAACDAPKVPCRNGQVYDTEEECRRASLAGCYSNGPCNWCSNESYQVYDAGVDAMEPQDAGLDPWPLDGGAAP